MIKKGSRPTIDINNLPDGCCQTRFIRIKIRNEFEEKFRHNRHRKSRNGYIKTGDTTIDSAFQRIRGRRMKQNIESLYSHSSRSQNFTNRHKQWGFHLWQDIELEDGMSFIDAIKHLMSLGVQIEAVEPIYNKKRQDIFIPNDTWFVQNKQWALKNIGQLDIDYPGTPGQYGIPGWDINISDAWTFETGKPEVIVAVIDEGIDFLHTDLAANIWDGIGVQGTNTIPGEHGTHVAGVISAINGNNASMTSIAGGDGGGRGVALMSLDLWGDHGLTTEQLFIYAADNGAAIAQNSWSYEFPNVYNQADLDGIDYFNQYGGGTQLQGGLTIFAAGNDDSEDPWYPGYYGYNDPNTLGALAVASHDNRGVKSDFSNYGDWVDIIAPGTWILSLAPDNGGMWMSGTSMACPHVSGVAALALSNIYQKITNEQLWDLLVNNTRDIYATNTSVYTNKLGSGALDAGAVLTASQAYQLSADALLYYRRDGVTYNVGMYLDIGVVGSNYLSIQANGQVYYIMLDVLSNEQASHLRYRKNNDTLAVISRA